jgi:hypothetical protein
LAAFRAAIQASLVPARLWAINSLAQVTQELITPLALTNLLVSPQ